MSVARCAEAQAECFTNALGELMEEPPGGVNHGRKRDEDGGWEALSPGNEKRAPRKRAVKPLKTVVHGTRSAYNNDKCRCAECKTAEALYRRQYRRENVTSTPYGRTPQEPPEPQ